MYIFSFSKNMKWIYNLWLTLFFSESLLWCASTLFVLSSHLFAHQSWTLVSVPLLNKHLERTTVSDVNIYQHMLPQSQCSLIDSLLFCVFSLSFKWSAHHILSKTTFTMTVWQCKTCKITWGVSPIWIEPVLKTMFGLYLISWVTFGFYLISWVLLDFTWSLGYFWILSDLLGTFGFYLISWVLLDFTWSLRYFWILPDLFTSFWFCLSQVPGKSDQCLLLLVD